MISHKSDNDYITNLVANINYEMFRKKITVKDISKKTGIAEATFRLRMNEPGTFKQSEIVPFIEEEIVVRYYFLEAGVQIRIRYDDALRQAMASPLIKQY